MMRNRQNKFRSVADSQRTTNIIKHPNIYGSFTSLLKINRQKHFCFSFLRIEFFNPRPQRKRENVAIFNYIFRKNSSRKRKKICSDCTFQRRPRQSAKKQTKSDSRIMFWMTSNEIWERFRLKFPTGNREETKRNSFGGEISFNFICFTWKSFAKVW